MGKAKVKKPKTTTGPMNLAELGLTPANGIALQVAATRVPALNELLPGGMVYGKWNLFFGQPSSGKTTICVQTVADAMAADPEHKCVLIPAEKGEDLQYYERMGLDLSRTYVIEKDQYIMEEVMEQLENIMKNAESLGIKSVIIDSWDGMLSYKQLYDSQGNRKDAVKETVAVKAAAGARLIPLIKGLTSSKKILFLIICQVRTKGIGGYTTYEGFAGGLALEHNTDVAVYMSISGKIVGDVDGNEQQIGNKVKFVLKKTKVNNKAHQWFEIPYTFEDGWDTFRSLWTTALEMGIIVNLGAGYFACDLYPEEGKKQEHKIRGEKKAIGFFQNDPTMIAKLQELVDQHEPTEQSSQEATEPE